MHAPSLSPSAALSPESRRASQDLKLTAVRLKALRALAFQTSLDEISAYLTASLYDVMERKGLDPAACAKLGFEHSGYGEFRVSQDKTPDGLRLLWALSHLEIELDDVLATQGEGSEPAMLPERREYKSEGEPASIADLPFVKTGERLDDCDFWHVTPTDDYSLACRIGQEYAAHFAQFLKDNPSWADSNVLGLIVSGIDFNDSRTAGYWTGFFSYLQRLIHAQAMHTDVFAYLDQVNARPEESKAKAAPEPGAEGGAA